MQIFDTNKKLVIIYLSKTGCLDYSKAMIKGFKQLDPLLVVAPQNFADFTAYNSITFKTYDSLFNALLHSIRIQARVNKLLDGLLEKHRDLELYFPAFHPWNLHFIKWSQKHSGCRTTLTVHDFITHSGETSALTEKLQRQSIRLADKVITLTMFVRDQLTKEMGSQEKCIVVPHPLLATKASNTLAHKSRPSLLFLGRVLDYKGVDQLIAATANLDIAKLTIAGRQKGKKFVSKDNVIVIDDYLDDAAFNNLLEEHHILVLPYLEASQSGVIALATYAEMVMVISKVGGLSEQLPADAAVWVEPTAAALRAGIELLMDSKETYDNIKATVKKHKERLQRSTIA